MKLPGLVRPLFLLVLGLHAGLLAIPISGASDEVIPPPDPEGDTITVTRIPPKDDEATAAAGSAQGARPASTGQWATQPQPTVTQVAAQPHQQRQASGQTRRRQSQSNSARQGDSTAGSTNADRTDGNNGQSTTGGSSSNSSSGPNGSSENGGNGINSGLDPLPADQQPATTPATNNDTTELTDGTTLIAALKEGAREGNLQALTNLIASFSDAFTYNDIQTSPEDEVEATNNWLAKLREETGKANLTQQALETPLKIPYPLEETVGFEADEWTYDRDFVGCLSQEPKPATVGLYFDERGSLADEPILLRSSGYGFLDTEALARAQQFNRLPEAIAGQAFTIPVEIEYDKADCWELDTPVAPGE
ncbi:MAG: energy transducer TonB [Cyanobacteria bacterium J06648_16]